MEIVTYGILGGVTLMLLAIHLVFKSRVFGVFVGLFLVMSGTLVLVSGVDQKIGEIRKINDTDVSNTYLNVTNTYENLKTTDPSQNNFLGVSLLLVGVYMLYQNGLDFFQKKMSPS